MQFQINTGTKSEDLEEIGRFFSEIKSYWLLHMVFMENKIRFSRSFNAYSEHISLSTYLWLVFQCSLKAWKQDNFNVLHRCVCVLKTASPIHAKQQKPYRLPHQLSSNFLSTALTTYTEITFFLDFASHWTPQDTNPGVTSVSIYYNRHFDSTSVSCS